MALPRCCSRVPGCPLPRRGLSQRSGPRGPHAAGTPPWSQHLGEGQKAGSIRGAAGRVRGSARAAALGKLSPGELRPRRAGGVLLACSCPEMFVPAAQKSCPSIPVLCGLLPPVPGVADGAVSPSAALARRCRCTKLMVPRCWARRRCPGFKQSRPISWPKEGLSQVQLWLSSQCQHHRFSCRSLSLFISTGTDVQGGCSRIPTASSRSSLLPGQCLAGFRLAESKSRPLPLAPAQHRAFSQGSPKANPREHLLHVPRFRTASRGPFQL